MTLNLGFMQAIDQAWNHRDWGRYEALLSPDLVAYMAGDEAPHDRAEHVKRAREFCEMFPSNQVVSHPYVMSFGSGDFTCTVARLSGRVTQPVTFPGLTKALEIGTTFDVLFSTVCRWRAGVIVEQYEFMDQRSLLRKFGSEK